MASGTSPERAEWRTIWLGTDEDQAERGWFPIEGEVRTTRLATFERKLTIGDATKDSDDFISSWIIGDFTGGGQIYDINEGSDIGRFWFGVADSRFVNQLSLPPEVVEYSLPTLEASYQKTIPLGDVPQTGATGVGAGNGVANGSLFTVWYNGKLFEYKSNDGTFASATFVEKPVTQTSLSTGSVSNVSYVPKPDHPGVPYTSTEGDQFLMVPSVDGAYSLSGKYGYVPAWTIENGQPAMLGLISVVAWKDILWGLTRNGLLYKTVNPHAMKVNGEYINTWERVDDASGAPLRLSQTQVPMHLTKHFVNMELVLLAVTDEQVWVYDTATTDAKWLETPAKYPPAPLHGLTSAQWRPGEDLWLTIGGDLLKYTNSQVMIPNSGPMREDGLPYEMSIVSNPLYPGSLIVSLSPEYNNLYALLYHNNGSLYPDMSLMCWTGSGWHCLWQGGKASNPKDLWSVVSSANASADTAVADQSMYRLWFSTASNKIYGMDLRKTFHNARVGARARIDRFASKVAKMGSANTTTDPWLETGQFDANMRNFEKLASHLIVDMEYADAVNYVRISYITDRDVDALNGTAYTMATASPNWHVLPTVVNKIGMTKIGLPDAGGFERGIPFRWIRFKIELVGPGGLDTPILNSIALAYTKIPQDTSSFVLTVPLPRETFMGRTGQEMADHLQEMLVNQQFLKFVHQNRTYRVRMAGLSGADSTGDDYAGARTLNLIEVSDA